MKSVKEIFFDEIDRIGKAIKSLELSIKEFEEEMAVIDLKDSWLRLQMCLPLILDAQEKKKS